MEGDYPWAQLETESPLLCSSRLRVTLYDVHALHFATVSQCYSGL